ncbi:MAG: MAPEG family protein [Rudaea sp.]|nr:MAPEG family protein [Rudaea sp.]
MTIELKMLGWSIVLGLAYVLIAAALGTAQRGLKWNAGNRDGDSKPLTGMAARVERASRNYLETFVFFAAAVLAVELAHRNTETTALGAQIYFWARVAYLPVYAVGIPYLRTVVWAVAFWGLLQVLEGLF